MVGAKIRTPLEIAHQPGPATPTRAEWSQALPREAVVEQSVGWIERSETHRDGASRPNDGFRFALPILRFSRCSHGVVPAKAGIHSHRKLLWREQAVAVEHTTTACGYGSWPSPGRRRHCEHSEAIHLSTRGGMDCFAALAMTGMGSDSNFKQREDVSLRSRGTNCPSFASLSALSLKRAQGKPGAGCTRGSRATKARG